MRRTPNYHYICFVYLHGEIVKSRCFVNEAAKNRYCNKQYDFNPESVVEVYDFNDIDRLIETWSA